MADAVEVGLNLPVINRQVTPTVLRDLAQLAEASGFAELYLGEHVVLFDKQRDLYPGAASADLPFPSDTPLVEPLTTHAFLAASTVKVRLATGVMVLPQRNPVYTAKHIATLDWLSSGRLDVAIGLGWSSLEYEACGVPFARRGERCDAYVDLMRSLWGAGPAEHRSEFYELPPARQHPKPVQQPGPPLWFGGMSIAALRRVASRGDGWYAFNLSPQRLDPLLDVLDAQLEAAGRGRDEIAVVIGSYGWAPSGPGDLAPFASRGVKQVALSLFSQDPADMLTEISRLGRQLELV